MTFIRAIAGIVVALCLVGVLASAMNLLDQWLGNDEEE